MSEPDRALQSVRLFLEDAEPWARKYHGDPICLSGTELHRATDRMATTILNSLVLLRGLQTSGPGFERRAFPRPGQTPLTVQPPH